MLNLYSTLKENKVYRKIELSELLFVEYTCMTEGSRFGIWSDNNYFAFIISGKKLWRSIHHSYEAEHGDILFVKKGANITHTFFDDEFCAIFIFIPDDFIKTFLTNNPALLSCAAKDLLGQDSVMRVFSDELLETYYHSVRAYLSMSEKPNEQLLKLKFEELLLSLFANKRHQQLTDYFISLCKGQQHHLSRIMETNFAYNLKIENFARLCNMSLSVFKTAFKNYYQTTPAVWLKDMRLALALRYILTSNLTISQISYKCGFEAPSHFIRLFRQKYQVPPLQYRQKYAEAERIEV